MKAEIHGKPSFSHLRMHLDPGDRVLAESDAMASMSTSIEMTTRLNGGAVSAVGRKVFGGESLFLNEFTTATGGDLVLTQPFPGDVESMLLNGNSMYITKGSFLACEPTVALGLGYAGVASLVGGEGLFRLKVSGHGTVWFGGYGSMYARDIEDELIVDSGHLVAYEPTLELKMGLAGGLLTSMLSGEGLITRVRGRGRVYLQSRSVSGLAAWTNGHLW